MINTVLGQNPSDNNENNLMDEFVQVQKQVAAKMAAVADVLTKKASGTVSLMNSGTMKADTMFRNIQRKFVSAASNVINKKVEKYD